ncbi:MAG: hypothetical protein QGG36_16075 [Pirellulaceae bacterium]|nr:hypothetical protein [Pirellulaceae bacterium]
MLTVLWGEPSQCIVSASLEGENPPKEIDANGRPVHPILHPRCSNLVWLQHSFQQRLVEDNIAFHEQKWPVDVRPGKPERVKVVGGGIPRIDDVLDRQVIFPLFEKLADATVQIANHNNEARESVAA